VFTKFASLSLSCLKSHKFFFLVLVAKLGSLHIGPGHTGVWRGAAAVLLPWMKPLLEELASCGNLEDLLLHLLHLLFHLCNNPLLLLVDHHQLQQLPLSILLLQLPILAAPS